MSNLKYFDCHSHPHDEKYEREKVDVDKILEDLKNDGGGTIAIGTDFENSVKALEIAKIHDNVWCTIGVHPADNHAEIFDERFEKLYAENKEKIVGVGECGLDYFSFEKMFADKIVGGEKGAIKSDRFFSAVESEKSRQKKLFQEQINFAAAHDLPLVLHGRPSKNSMDAYRDMLDILENLSNPEFTDEVAKTGALQGASPSLTPIFSTSSENSQKFRLKGHAHFFVGNLEIAKRFLDLGFLMSFDGPVTFTNEYDAVIQFLPLDKIMIETDSPYAAPAPFRGQTNFPIYVKEVAKKIALLKNISVEEALEQTKENAKKLFRLDI